MYRQRIIKGHHRRPLPACVMQAIWKCVDQTSKKFNVSRSFVIATALADTFHVRGQEDYKTVERKRKSNGR